MTMSGTTVESSDDLTLTSQNKLEARWTSWFTVNAPSMHGGTVDLNVVLK